MLVSRQEGLGATGGQLAASATGVAASTVSLLALPAIGLLPAIAGPIGLAVAGLVSLLAAFGVGSGCGESCIAASNDANAIEPALQANLAAFLQGKITQAQAEANFQALLVQLQQGCAQVGGSAGQHCISDRQSGSCKWQTSPGGWQQNSDGSWAYVYPGANGSGTTCWNWFVGYSDPIQNAPAGFVQSAASPTATADLSPLLICAGIGLAAAVIL